MSNPNVPQGSLNRLLTSLVIPDFPELNVIPPFLGKEAIRLGFNGDSTLYIDQLTGAVTSPEPYIRATVRVNLLKTQGLAAQYKAQMEFDARVGDITLQGDSSALPVYQLSNCAIQSIDELNFDGTDAGYRVTIGGIYNINNNLYDEA